ncbi:17972_t:CDS:2 [Funneliformis geosporum]|uniref:Acetyltransferase n=1 Tax=Funneliformis geosporum TaxID=1117311 RepID=A0A9W4WJU0_9GLOM|nr:17972_t:CDS:2 [Funneliformis geosporum]CAI2167179.1 19850_t:CDS:2 [Funneliformis geosporum]
MSETNDSSENMQSEREKALAGLPYLAYSKELINDRLKTREILYEYNNSKPVSVGTVEYREGRERMIRQLFGSAGENVEVEPPFYCDYGYNIHVGNDFYCNFNCTILDCNKVEIGDRVLFGPNVSLYPATHHIEPEERAKGPELAFPIKVTKNVPSYVVVAGNPAKIIKHIERKTDKI